MKCFIEDPNSSVMFRIAYSCFAYLIYLPYYYDLEIEIRSNA